MAARQRAVCGELRAKDSFGEELRAACTRDAERRGERVNEEDERRVEEAAGAERVGVGHRAAATADVATANSDAALHEL